MDDRLKSAAQIGDINMIYTLIQEDPYLLDRVDCIPFIDTPLHTAACFGHVQFAMEIMKLKPSFARKLNQQGFSPMHLALQNGQTMMVLRFLNYESELVRVKGRESKTPLHYVAEQGDVNLLTKILSACPLSIQDVTIRSETALHIAVKNYQIDALDFLLGGLRRSFSKGSNIREKKIINWKEEEGNTALHIAAATNQPHAVRLLIKSRADVNAKKLEGLSALDISKPDNREITKSLLSAGAISYESPLQVSNSKNEHLRSKMSFKEQVVVCAIRLKNNTKNETRNVLLVVAALIATATYQAALNPPGGLWQDNNNASNTAHAANEGSSELHKAGTIIMGSGYLCFFYIVNSVSLFMTILVIFFLLPSGRMSQLLSFPLYFFSVCYISSWMIVSPRSINLSCFCLILSLLYSIACIWLVILHNLEVHQLTRKT